MRTSTRRALVIATALTATVSLAACTGATGGDGAVAAPDQVTDTDTDTDTTVVHNAADTVFAQMMIVHHEGALEMAQLVLARSANDDVRELAQRIADAQGPEITQMSDWLGAWGEHQPAETEHAGMDHAGMDMDGMGQDEAMAVLGELEGAELDRTFLELMIAHHRGAIVMAEALLADGAHPDARALARTIIDAQTAEMTEMENLLRSW